jgi:ATP adenylyltransferase/5',5'''-P-1,P-4-tetraphosphate phosphorylase II
MFDLSNLAQDFCHVNHEMKRQIFGFKLKVLQRLGGVLRQALQRKKCFSLLITNEYIIVLTVSQKYMWDLHGYW